MDEIACQYTGDGRVGDAAARVKDVVSRIPVDMPRLCRSVASGLIGNEQLVILAQVVVHARAPDVAVLLCADR